MLTVFLYVLLVLAVWVVIGFTYFYVNLGKKSFHTNEPPWEFVVTGPAILCIMLVMQFSRVRK